MYNAVTLHNSQLPERIKKKIVLQPCAIKGLIGDCWAWQGFKYQGYGRYRINSKITKKAHRVVYELLKGPIPEGLESDHLCLNRSCVNPDHIEPVTRAENLRRSHVTGAGNGARTHCRQGHEFTNKNTYAWRGKRFCLKCQSIRQEAYEKRKAERVL